MATGERVGRDTSVDVSGRVVTSTGSTTARTLAARFADVVNVRDFGAACDNVTDDTLAVRAAVTAAQSAAGTLVVPSACRVTAAITVSSSIRIVGAKPGAGLYGTGTWATPLLIVSGSDVAVSDLTISAAGHKVPQLVKITGSRVRLSRLTITGAGRFTHAEAMANGSLRPIAGVWIQGTRGSNDVADVTVEDCVFTGNGATDSYGHDIVSGWNAADTYRTRILRNRFSGGNTVIPIVLFDSSDSLIEGNFVDQNNQSDEYTAHASLTQDDGYGILIYNTPPATLPCTRNMVRGNHVKNSASSGIYFQGNTYSSIVGNIIENACQVPDGAFVPDTSVNVGGIAANGGYPASPEGVGVVIADNVIRTSGKNGISIATTRGAVVSGNTIENAVKYGIDVRNPEPGAVVATNVIRGASLRGISFTGGTAPPVGLGTSGNSIDGAAIGIFVQEGSQSITLANDRIRNCTSYGILAVSSDYIHITGAQLSNNLGRGIYVGGRSSLVENSLIFSTTSGGIGVQVHVNATDVLVAGNTINGSTDRAFFDAGTRTTFRGNTMRFNTNASTTTATTLLEKNQREGGVLSGTATLVAGTVTVATSEVLAGDVIRISRTALGGTPGHLSVGTITASTSFVINSSSASDTSTVSWEIVH